MGRWIDLTGNKYGKMTPIRYERGNRKNPGKWLCQCECGKTSMVYGKDLTSGHTTSCGCKRAETIREEYGTTYMYRDEPLYRIWKGMRQRCNNANSSNYKWYGERGIKVCDSWSGKNGFLSFREWALRNGWSKELELDRIDTNKDYEPNNCRWVTHIENMQNIRVNRVVFINGRRFTITQFVELTGVKRWRVYEWFKSGNCEEVAKAFLLSR